MLLPQVETTADYRRLRDQPEVWRPALESICRRHGLNSSRLEFSPTGWNVIFRVGSEAYVKLFPLPWRDECDVERIVLETLGNRPGSLAPRLIASGEIEAKPYLVTAAVESVPLRAVWPSLGTAEKESITVQIGEWLAVLHAVPTEGLDALKTYWRTFLARCQRRCLARHAEAGAQEPWLSAIGELLDEAPPLFEWGFTPVLLHADLKDENLLVCERGGRWELSGVIDFGDAMLGHPYYDLVAPGLYVTRGAPALQRTLLRAYGFAEEQIDATLAHQLMAYTLLYPYGSLPMFLRLFGAHPPDDLPSLQEALWSPLVA